MKKKSVVLLALLLLSLVASSHTLGDVAEKYLTETDDLTDWSKVASRSPTLTLKTSGTSSGTSSGAASGAASADPTRAYGSGKSGEYLVYKAKGYLRSFSVEAYSSASAEGSKSPQPTPLLSISADGKTYRAVTPDIHASGDGSGRMLYESREFPSGIKYLKIVYPSGNGGAVFSIGRVVLNGDGDGGTGASANASKPSGPVLYGSMIRLTAASGQMIYYTTDGSDPRSSSTRQRYGSPIAIVGETVLKTTAEGAAATGTTATGTTTTATSQASSASPTASSGKTAGDVSTYTFTPYPQAPPASGIADPLDDFALTALRSNLYLAKDTPSYFGNDSSRAVRATTAPGMLIYVSAEDIESFAVLSFYFSGLAFEKLKFYVSSDGTEYNEVAAESYPSGDPVSNWQPQAYENMSLPAGTRYLKIELTGTAKSWTPQVSEVLINRNTASAALTTAKSDSGMLATLSSATKGARLYYRLNDSADFVPYVSPLKLTGYNSLEAYAVKEGLLPSPIRSYSVNASKDVQVDRFGQMETAKFAAKVTEESQLAADAAADETYYASLKEPTDRDRYGGLSGSASTYGLKATGFFDVQNLTGSGRPVLTTPSGNLFFSLGVNGVTAQETYTLIKGREAKFEYVPPYAGEYKPAYTSTDGFSFFVANKYKKTGVFPTEHDIYVEAIERLKKWGFNGIGAFSTEKYGEEGMFPYVRMLPLEGMSWAKIDGLSLFDIYAPGAEEKLDQSFAQNVAPYKDDPMLIGTFIGNEYDFHKFLTEVPKLKASKAAMKGALVDMLQKKYGTIGAFNTAWKMNYKSFADLREAELVLKASPAWRDMEAFLADYLDRFFGTVSRLYRKYDPNHLLLGDRWITTTFHNETVRRMLSEYEGKYVDVISINYYTYSLEPELLKEVYEKSGGKPILMSEFGYGTSEQGLEPLMKNSAINQFQRGMRYRNYVEGVASLPYVVGANVFNYVDQAGLGRYWQGIWGEHYNSGLVNVADRPYKDYIAAAKATNDDIYKIMLGKRAKFYYDFSKK
ncbi:chitobiase/beta-hexosaminidase C-terminal domain-containing protein [Cohnella fermenti]|uniref:Glycoside hydrolase family 42 N-terminal domain-containing protein n=1 Tax=Cohnella fermenti TaxID=2565925 RepID=A0A4S4BML8_9BACL|nr:FN3 associated domain-containing protein [Cohnella fermenti]THF73666.1 hypothetical protein E6C55_28180 [Cohnella fermenti]